MADLGLGLRAGWCLDVEDLSRRSDLLARFFRQRSLDPRGTERTQGVHGEIYNLHARNPLRGVTWWDQDHDIVFLLAATREHDYTLFTDRDRRGELMPTVHDYLDVFEHRKALVSQYGYNDFLADVEPVLAQMLAEARERPGVVVSRTVAQGMVGAHMVVEVVAGLEDFDGDVYAAVQFRGARIAFPPTVVDDLAVAAFPDAEPDHLDIGVTFPARYGARHDDIALRWRRPTD